MTLYENIKARRLALKLSQEDLARKLGYKSTSTIAKIEAGKIDIPQSKIKAFADALNTTPGDLMGWYDESASYNNEEKTSNASKVLKKELNHYYFNEETAKIAQAIHDDKNLRILFDASQKLEPEDVQYVVDLVKRLKKKESGGDDES